MTKKKPNIFNLPNAITVIRICLVPLVVWSLLIGEFLAGFILFAVAGASDFVDGWLARFQKIQTSFGAYLDPVADKLLMAAVYITLWFLNFIPTWLVALVVARDLIIILGIIWAEVKQRKFKIEPLKISKFNTLIQIVVIVMLLANLAFVLNLDQLLFGGFILVGISTVISSFAYLYLWATTWFKQPPK